MYTLVSSTNKTVRQKVNLIKQLLVVRCILYFPQKIKLTTMLCILHDILFKVALKPLKLVTMLYFIPGIFLKVALNTNKSGHHVIHVPYNWHCWKWLQAPRKLVTILYIKSYTLLKVALSTNKTGHHVRTNWRIIESGVKHQ